MRVSGCSGPRFALADSLATTSWMIGTASAERPRLSSTCARRFRLARVFRCSGPSSTLADCLAAMSWMIGSASAADTTTPHGRLTLTVLGGLAEFERELIRARTGEGRKRAQARGVRFGRKPKLTAHQRQEAIARREAGETLVDIARSYNVSHPTIMRLVQ